jgi:two-component system chemotaxis response regulator CheY
MPQRILLVDDSPTILNLLGLVFREHGYEVRQAKDGLEALELLQREPVDLIITDVNMPRLDGFSLISAVRAQPGLAKLPIIVLSTEASPRDQELGLLRGANLYLVKPLGPLELVSHVRSLI